MQIKKILLSLLFFALCSPVFSYNIYNKTSHSVMVYDDSTGGIEAAVPVNGSVSCNPKARGCWGKMVFQVYSTEPRRRLLCTWYGTLTKGKGNYFVIFPVANKKYPEFGSCKLEYFHD